MPSAEKRTPPRSRRRGAPSSLPVFGGTFGRAEAERLLWRAGFGPRPGEADAAAERGLIATVDALLAPPRARLDGPAPSDGKGRPLAPRDAWGHEHLWWLDRMVRSNQPLVERMTLVWHDWFATSRDGAPANLLIRQNETMRRHSLGSFRSLLLEMTRDPAMLLWLSGSQNHRWSPNENYARELMELFTLGPTAGYTERDVREMARALTGWANDWDEATGPVRFRFERARHDPGVKRILGRRGRFDWRDACRLCLEHPRHASFAVRKLWDAFIPVAPSARDRAELARLYRRNGWSVKPVLRAILLHPALHAGPRMVKPPVVHVAGMLRALGRGVDTDGWTWICDLTGQRLFLPPNVAGWDESRWLDTGTFRGRWIAAETAMRPFAPADDAPVDVSRTPAQAVDDALEFWGRPTLTAATRAGLEALADTAATRADRPWKVPVYHRQRQTALRALIATSPDFLTS